MLSCRLALPKTRPSRRPIIINTHVTLGAAPGSRVLPWPHRTHRSVDSPALPQAWPDSIEALPHQYRPLLERTEEALITRIGPTQRDRAPRASRPRPPNPPAEGARLWARALAQLQRAVQAEEEEGHAPSGWLPAPTGNPSPATRSEAGRPPHQHMPPRRDRGAARLRRALRGVRGLKRVASRVRGDSRADADHGRELSCIGTLVARGGCGASQRRRPRRRRSDGATAAHGERGRMEGGGGGQRRRRRPPRGLGGAARAPGDRRDPGHTIAESWRHDNTTEQHERAVEHTHDTTHTQARWAEARAWKTAKTARGGGVGREHKRNKRRWRRRRNDHGEGAAAGRSGDGRGWRGRRRRGEGGGGGEAAAAAAALTPPWRRPPSASGGRRSPP